MQLASPDDVSLGVDLKSAAIDLLDHLRQFDKYPGLYSGSVLDRAIWRYRERWLPLAAEYKDEVLSAPTDIEWVWHCHMLAPVAYQRDCLNNLGLVVNHECRNIEAYTQAVSLSMECWNRKYPDDPFYVQMDGSDIDESEWQDQSLGNVQLTYDLVAAAGRQRVFYYQVSLPHYRSPMFLERAQERYKKFLFLKQKYPHTFLVPCYDMDLIWHTHMNFPLSYKAVTELVLGDMLNHDDSVNDRSDGSKLVRADAYTRKLWRARFNEHFATFGGMYRGDPPIGKLEIPAEEPLNQMPTKLVRFEFNSIRVSGEGIEKLVKFKLYIIEQEKVEMRNYYGKIVDSFDSSEVMLSLRGPEQSWECPGNFMKTINCTNFNNLYIGIRQSNKSFFCFSGREEFHEQSQINLEPFCDKLTKEHDKINHVFEIDLDADIHVTMDATISLVCLQSCELSLTAGSYEECIMPEQIEQIWGPVPLPRLPMGVDNNCSVASHRLKNYRGEVHFTCRVLHSLPLLMSAIHVFHHDKMVAVAHLIGSDQLPKPADVADLQKSLTLDPRRGERAMIIKNGAGDWAILVGRWDGFQRGRPPTKGRAGVRGSPGHLTVLMYKIPTTEWEIVSVKEEHTYGTEEFRFKLGDAKVDLQTGIVSVQCRKQNEIAEHLALAFSVSLLHVLLQPRPSSWEPGQSVELPVSRRGGRVVAGVKADKMAWVMAAGLIIATPSNHHIKHNFKGYPMAGGMGQNQGDQSDDRNEERSNGNPTEGQNEETDPADIITDLLNDGDDDENEGEGEAPENDFADFIAGDDMDDFDGEFGTDLYGEDMNTFLGDMNFGNADGEEGGGGNTDGGGWGVGYEDADGGGCGGCGAGDGGGGSGGFGLGFSDGGGGGDSGGGGGVFDGGAFSGGGAFDSGDGGGGGFDFGGGGGGDGGGWGDGGGDGGGGDGGGCGGCGGCGG